MDSPTNPCPFEVFNRTEQIWIVQKYGGTSIGKFAKSIANEIVPYVSSVECPTIVANTSITSKRATIRKFRVAIVCSARSNNSKGGGTTSRYVFLIL